MEVKATRAAREIAQQVLPMPKVHINEFESPSLTTELKPLGGGADTGARKDLKKLQEDLEKINNALIVKNIALHYSIDEETEDIVVKVIEKGSGKVIRQIPSEEVLRLRGRIKELLGVIFDENV
jgi:flagellar protein FlaG